MNIDIEKLRKNALFKNLSSAEILNFLDLVKCTQLTYEKDSMVVVEKDLCANIGFVIEGNLTIQQYSRNGEAMTIDTFKDGDCFGAPLLFTNEPLYPFTLRTLSKSTVLFVPFEEMHRMLRENQTLNFNYLTFLSRHIVVLKNKVKVLSHNDVRSRLIIYLSEEMEIAGSSTFKLRHKKTEIGEILKVARPSISRELSNMEKDNLITLDRSKVTILAPEEFVL